jgi:hypothetical protein
VKVKILVAKSLNPLLLIAQRDGHAKHAQLVCQVVIAFLPATKNIANCCRLIMDVIICIVLGKS